MTATRYKVIETALCIGESVFEGEEVVVLAADYDRLEQECERVKADLALALKVPSVAAMHTYLDTVCARQNVQFAAERDAALKQVEGLREALARIINRCDLFVGDDADMGVHSVEVLAGIAKRALQAKP